MILLPRILQGSSYLWEIERPVPGMSAADFLVGVLLTAALPAVVWCGLIKGAAVMFNFDMSVGALVMVGLFITTFLSSIYACFARNL